MKLWTTYESTFLFLFSFHRFQLSKYYFVSQKLSSKLPTQNSLKIRRCVMSSNEKCTVDDNIVLCIYIDQIENRSLVLTKNIIIRSNRRMFPTVRVSFTGLRADQRYAVLMDIVPVDNKRYRYAYHRSSWLVAGKADPPAPHRLYTHPDSPFTGDQLRKQVVSFEKVKLTNNEMDKHGHVRT